MPYSTKSSNQHNEYSLRKKQLDNYTNQLVQIDIDNKAAKTSLKDVLNLSKIEVKKLRIKSAAYENYIWYLEKKINNITKLDSC